MKFGWHIRSNYLALHPIKEFFKEFNELSIAGQEIYRIIMLK